MPYAVLKQQEGNTIEVRRQPGIPGLPIAERHLLQQTNAELPGCCHCRLNCSAENELHQGGSQSSLCLAIWQLLTWFCGRSLFASRASACKASHSDGVQLLTYAGLTQTLQFSAISCCTEDAHGLLLPAHHIVVMCQLADETAYL